MQATTARGPEAGWREEAAPVVELELALAAADLLVLVVGLLVVVGTVAAVVPLVAVEVTETLMLVPVPVVASDVGTSGAVLVSDITVGSDSVDAGVSSLSTKRSEYTGIGW